MAGPKLHLVDGTYELFRAYFGAPPARSPERPRGGRHARPAALAAGARARGRRHARGRAFDHVIESFRNELFPGYKTGEGVPADLMAQFPLAERATAGARPRLLADGRASRPTTPWPPRRRAGPTRRASSRCCSARPTRTWRSACAGTRVVRLDRMRRLLLDEAGVEAEVRRAARVDPRLAGAGRRRRRRHPGRAALGRQVGGDRAGPLRAHRGDPGRRGAVGPARARRAAAWRPAWPAAAARRALYKRLATLRTDVPLAETLATSSGRAPGGRSCWPSAARSATTTCRGASPAGAASAWASTPGAAPC